ncbi:hypothetical protein GCM10010405_29050 [Streptomyces macrosporus]|uniref:Lipoprotein n=1 Tax=Streptomyces macrosporus TaxID=44032 RepID=A0ABN3JY12_9ACTN
MAALTAGLLTCSAACTGPGADRDDHAPFQALLDRQAEAVLDGDRGAYLATVDPRAERYRAAQRTVFRNLTRLPLAQWSYRVTAAGDGAFPLPDEAGGEGAPRRVAVRAELRYRVRGYDTVPVRAEEYLTLTERKGRWYVSSDGDGGGDGGGRRGTEQLWEQGEMTVVRGKRSLVLGVGREKAALRALAADADRAVPRVAAVWPREWPRRVLVQAPATLERMAALLGGSASTYRGVAAVTTGEVGGRGEAPAERIVVNPQAYGLLSEEGRRIVMTHETTHVATRPHTTDATPMWLSEGFADWVGYRDTGRPPTRVAPRLTDAVRRDEVPRRLPSDEDFDFAGDADRLARAYESGWLACRLVAREWGEEKLIELYLAAARGADGASDDGDAEAEERATDAAVRETLGIGLEELTARWRDHVREELGG